MTQDPDADPADAAAMTDAVERLLTSPDWTRRLDAARASRARILDARERAGEEPRRRQLPGPDERHPPVTPPDTSPVQDVNAIWDRRLEKARDARRDVLAQREAAETLAGKIAPVDDLSSPQPSDKETVSLAPLGDTVPVRSARSRFPLSRGLVLAGLVLAGLVLAGLVLAGLTFGLLAVRFLGPDRTVVPGTAPLSMPEAETGRAPVAPPAKVPVQPIRETLRAPAFALPPPAKGRTPLAFSGLEGGSASGRGLAFDPAVGQVAAATAELPWLVAPPASSPSSSPAGSPAAPDQGAANAFDTALMPKPAALSATPAVIRPPPRPAYQDQVDDLARLRALGLPGPIRVHLSASIPDAALKGSGALNVVKSRYATPRTLVRFYHDTDAGTAADVARALHAVAADFTAYAPRPPQGSIEIWLGDTDRAAISPSTPVPRPDAP